MQLAKLNVKGAACDLSYVSMGINHGKFTPENIRHAHSKRVPSKRLKSSHVSPVTVFWSSTWGLIARTLRYLYNFSDLSMAHHPLFD